MDEMKPVSRSLLSIPPEIIEEILLYLALPDRKNLRLTCKQLYELCNSDRFCGNEKVIWSEDLNNHENVESDLSRIGRQFYNLEITAHKLKKSSIFPFFEKHGVKVRSLVIHDCDCRPGALEFIIMQCEGLRSLCMTEKRLSALDSTLQSFKFKPPLITRPNVTYLKLTLPAKKPSDFFHPMISIFPNVKQLHIEEHPDSLWDLDDMSRISNFPLILHDVVKLGGNLECLELKIPLSKSITRMSNFFEALPHLMDLTIDGAHVIIGKLEKWFPRNSNLVSVKLSQFPVICPSLIMRLLTNTRLKYLSLQSTYLTMDKESFEKLVTSQLDTIRFDPAYEAKGLPAIMQDSPLEANRTVKNLYLNLCHQCPDSELAKMLFLKYFHGLIHLSIWAVTDSILQNIFQFQENLRSLELGSCIDCSINGFCGSKDGGSEYSLHNLQTLEYLSIRFVPSEVLESDDFKRVLCLSRLNYLRLNWEIGNDNVSNAPRYAGIPPVLYENLTELRALRLKDNAMPSRETLLSVFSCLKHLNYLRYDMDTTKDAIISSVTFINCQYFSIPTKKYKYGYTLGCVYFDKELDRLVILKAGLKQTFHVPKIGAFEIDWLEA